MGKQPNYCLVALLWAAMIFAGEARAESCGQLWQARNAIFAEAGFCFRTQRAVAAFGSRCYPPYGRLSGAQQARVNAIIDEEARRGCSGESAAQELVEPPQETDVLPGPAPADRLNEAASVWGATKDTTSPAILEAFIARFGDTAFGDLARARLAEVAKSTAPAGGVDPAQTEMCPKYIPAAAKIVQVPCER